MKNLIISGTALLSLLIAPLALAQTYYSTGTCVSIPASLSIGSRGSDVTNLQNFLVAQRYPGGGSWMITGYFGQATAAAVRNFQQQQGLPQTGMTDAATASAISRVSCGSAALYPTQTYPFTAPTPVQSYPTPTYPYFNNNYYGNAPVITSLSQNTGFSGNVITIYGVGFDQSNNTVNFGGTAVYNVPSSNGTSLTVTVPNNYFSYSLAGTLVQLTVQNLRGTSNPMSFTVLGSSNACGPYFSTSCGCPNQYQYGYNQYCPPQNAVTPIVNYITPTSGGVGTTVNIYGSGFSATGNSVRFGTGIIANLSSFDGQGLSFVVPASLSGFGNQPITLSTYQVSVSNALGNTSNSVPFTVTSLVTSGSAPAITSVTGPTNLAPGQQGTWTLAVNTMNNQYLTLSVNWGDQAYAPAAASQQLYGYGQQTNTLTHTYTQSGTFTVVFTVSNSAGLQNSYTTTVYVTGSTVVPFSALPSSGAAPLAVVFSANNLSNQYFYQVNFGDGQIAFGAPTPAAPTLMHTYTGRGTFTARLEQAPNVCYGVAYSCTQPTPTNWTLVSSASVVVQ